MIISFNRTPKRIKYMATFSHWQKPRTEQGLFPHRGDLVTFLPDLTIFLNTDS